MRHTVLSDIEIKNLEESRTSEIFKEGNYTFEVISAKDTLSKTSGNEMIEVQINIMKFKNLKVRDWLVGTDSCAWKVVSFFKSIGRMDIYKQDTIEPMLLEGCKGTARFKRNDKGYIEVAYYIKKEEQYSTGSTHENTSAPSNNELNEFDEFVDDDVPF